MGEWLARRRFNLIDIAILAISWQFFLHGHWILGILALLIGAIASRELEDLFW